MIKRVQLFAHRYYEAIKLFLLILVLGVAVSTVIYQMWQYEQASIGRTRAVAEVAEAVKRETEAQTDIINRQFRAICLLIVDTSGARGLERLDNITRERCEDLINNPEAQINEETTASQVSQSPTVAPRQSETPSQPPTPQPTPPTPAPAEEPGLVGRTVDRVNRTINSIFDILRL